MAKVKTNPLFSSAFGQWNIKIRSRGKKEKMMDADKKFYASLVILQTLITLIPDGIKGLSEIINAYQKADPTAEDFEALVTIAEALRPKDPLAK